MSATHYQGYAGDRDARVFRPARADTPPIVVLLHGGGFAAGSLEAIAPLAMEFAERLGVAVVTPAYTLACERPFPAAAEDAYAALTWANVSARRERWDARHIVVAGVEAGGNLAAVAAMMARDRGGPRLAAQVLLAPMLDPSLTARSMQCVAGTARDAAYRAYLPNAADRMHPYAAPASCSRLGGLAPALILTAATDPLRDEAEGYGAQLIGAGVTTQVSRLARIEVDAAHWTEDTWNAIAAFLQPRISH